MVEDIEVLLMGVILYGIEGHEAVFYRPDLELCMKGDTYNAQVQCSHLGGGSLWIA